ncbi:MAG: aldehyde ferredoxin oxidoreductase family protein [Spirochaetales bacterium]|nr:aldehyde ferredoxin oxidoreductase family protein [Spirochaetales bacterium]
MYGFNGRLLRVDLTAKKVLVEDIAEDLLEKFLGGRGLASWYFYNEVPAGADPLGEENKLIFFSGLLTGTISPSASRYSVVTKSPLTGIWAQSSSGGRWGVDLKRAGYDGVIFEGRADHPVYLRIDDGEAELLDAKELWGRDVFETVDMIKREDSRLNVACIGTAGENLVKYASIMNDRHRAAGRCGPGAVMGSKNLKAVAVKGKNKIEIAHPEDFKRIAGDHTELLGESILGAGLQGYGTNLVLDMVNNCGGLPTRNWQRGVFDRVDEVNGTAVTEKVLEQAVGCFACPIKCGRKTKIKSGPYAGESGEGPEYETVGVFGPMCDVSDIESITKAGYLCNDLGLDTISCGSSIAFAMECFEKSRLTVEDTGGIKIEFGNAQAIIELIPLIARREGIGNLLAEGTRIMSSRLGGDTADYAMQVKGLELACYDSRAAKITGLAFATANRGGDHITAYVQGPTFLASPFLVIDDSEIADPLEENPEEAHVVKELEDALAVFDSAGSCKFMGMALDAREWSETIRALTGWDFDVDEFRKIGERIYNLERAFNVREGITRADDTLPRRLLEEPLPDGPAAGQVNHIGPMLDRYYELRGWDPETGKPTAGTLKRLGLASIAKALYGG